MHASSVYSFTPRKKENLSESDWNREFIANQFPKENAPQTRNVKSKWAKYDTAATSGSSEVLEHLHMIGWRTTDHSCKVFLIVYPWSKTDFCRSAKISAKSFQKEKKNDCYFLRLYLPFPLQCAQKEKHNLNTCLHQKEKSKDKPHFFFPLNLQQNVIRYKGDRDIPMPRAAF